MQRWSRPAPNTQSERIAPLRPKPRGSLQMPRRTRREALNALFEMNEEGCRRRAGGPAHRTAPPPKAGGRLRCRNEVERCWGRGKRSRCIAARRSQSALSSLNCIQPAVPIHDRLQRT